MTARSPRAAVALVITVTVALGVVFSLFHIPSAVLFGALIGGMAHSLTSTTKVDVPFGLFRLGQAIIGVIIGGTVTGAALRRIGHDALPIALVVIATIAASLVAGQLLARRGYVSPVTGGFAMIAGGASGLVALAHEMGADDRVVILVQYLRVLMVLVTLPLVTTLIFHPDRGAAVAGVATGAGWVHDWAFVLISVAVGLGIARIVRFTTASLLGPLTVAAIIAMSGWLGAVHVPEAAQHLAFGLIGAQVGLRFTRASIASIRRMLPAVLALMAVIIAVCAGIGALLAWGTSVDALTAYLATSPGGMFAVLSIAADSDSDATYVLGVQLCRMLVVLGCIPFIGKWLAGRSAADG